MHLSLNSVQFTTHISDLGDVKPASVADTQSSSSATRPRGAPHRLNQCGQSGWPFTAKRRNRISGSSMIMAAFMRGLDGYTEYTVEKYSSRTLPQRVNTWVSWMLSGQL